MKVSLAWLKDYINLNWSAEKLAEELTMRSIEVNTVEKGSVFDDNLVIGKVMVVSKHPNADKLTLAVVDTGTQQVKVVCGAPNLAEGQKIVLAPVGAVLRPIKGDEIKIRKAQIRGIESPGMICSEAELGLSEEAEGILVLAEDAQVGQKLKDYFGTKDVVFDLDVLANRPDCMGHLGVAREIAAISKSSLKVPKFELDDKPKHGTELKVEIADQNICPRYSALVISGIKIKESLKLIQDRLLACGFRPINNIVDLTNYLMLDLGQPFHAFDYQKVAGSLMRVRPAKKGEIVTTLDGTQRKLASGIPVISDQEKLIDLAGIMGGANTEIDQSTNTIVLQAAVFDAFAVRRAARLLGHRTDAVGRYEKGVDLNGTVNALARAYQLLKEQSPEIQLEQIIDQGQKSVPEKEITLELARVEKLLGLAIDSPTIKSILNSLGLKIKKEKKQSIKVAVPSFRPDLVGEEDLVEEVARIYGYDQLPETVISAKLKPPTLEPARILEQKISRELAHLGFREVINYSFISEKSIASLGLAPESHIEVVNPLSEEQRYLRSEHVSSLLTCVSGNLRFRNEVRLFELGKIYTRTKLGRPEEKFIASGVVCLPDKAESFSWAKGTLTRLWQQLNLSPLEEAIVPDRQKSCPYWQAWDPDCALKFVLGKDVVGTVAAINPTVLNKFDIDSTLSIAYFMIFSSTLVKHVSQIKEYAQLPRFPAVNLDIAFTVSKEIEYKEIEQTIKRAGGKLLKRVELFDVYQGKQTGGQKSLAFHLDYRADNKTLELEEAQEIHKQIAAKLKSQIGAELR